MSDEKKTPDWVLKEQKEDIGPRSGIKSEFDEEAARTMANESGWKDVPEDGYMEATAYVSGAGQQWEQGKHTRQFLEGAIELSMDYVKILEAERDELRSEVRKYKNAATEWMAAYDALAEKYEPRVAVHGEGDE